MSRTRVSVTLPERDEKKETVCLPLVRWSHGICLGNNEYRANRLVAVFGEDAAADL